MKDTEEDGEQGGGISAASLAEPQLVHAKKQDDSYTLDLQSVDVKTDGAVRVLIPAYPERDAGDKLVVKFVRGNVEDASYPYPAVINRYRYLKDPSNDPPTANYELRFQPLNALPPGRYEVSYMVTSRFDNTASSKSASVDIVGGPYPPASAGQATFYGFYLPGVLRSWLVPNSCSLTPSEILWSSLGTSTAKAQIGVYQQKNGQPEHRLVLLECGDDGTTWKPSPNQDIAQFEPGDLVTVRLESGQGEQGMDLHVSISL